jgi:hypothetical protein
VMNVSWPLQPHDWKHYISWAKVLSSTSLYPLCLYIAHLKVPVLLYYIELKFILQKLWAWRLQPLKNSCQYCS